jgi:hypothetical protein
MLAIADGLTELHPHNMHSSANLNILNWHVTHLLIYIGRATETSVSESSCVE